MTTDREMFNLAAWMAHQKGLTVEHFKSDSREHRISKPRQAFMREAHRRGYSMPQIGRFLNRHHTTVLFGIRADKEREARHG